MARKHKRRTRKRNRKGGFLGPSMSAKVGEGVQGWKDIGASGQRVVRGGSYFHDDQGIRAAQRWFVDRPTDRGKILGFRVVVVASDDR